MIRIFPAARGGAASGCPAARSSDGDRDRRRLLAIIFATEFYTRRSANRGRISTISTQAELAR
jgi:hypothetical protein